ncbi:hypothetical protein EMPS_03999 [Entomortierella parvispora]|uniref:RGS domain-containing protein n=1 Tax=Entomortierella parvispora TaxID=205924 RepID=A0A9P3LV62_9FUNG|nr:hypothetical protein EMPS_03999 [Entomortierella parvispora]
MHEDLMLSRRQKTLSSISNYIPLHILLNEPAGISFSITVSKSWTIEQLARQIEAEYAYLVEREIPGGSNYPVIECGALFDHVDFKGSKRPALAQSAKSLGLQKQQHAQPQRPQEQVQRGRERERRKDDSTQGLATASTLTSTTRVSVDCDQQVPRENNHLSAVDNGDEDQICDGDEDDSVHEHEHLCDNDTEDEVDHRTEAESRGVQLRFSDRIEDVLDRDSTVHVVNIDQGLGMGRKLSLTNLALAISHEAASTPDASPLLDTSTIPSTDAATPAPGITRATVEIPQSTNALPSSRVLSAHPCLRDIQKPPLEDHLSTYTTPSTQDHGSGVEHSDIKSHSHGDMTPASLLWEQAVSESAESDAEVQGQGRLQDSRIVSVSGSFPSSPLASSSPLAATAGEESPSLSAIPACVSTSVRGSTPIRPRSRATDILLNLESSSNDARFQEILHNTIALDHFRQFCFQEYSIENLLFWLDVELFSKGGDPAKPEGDPTDQKSDRSRGGLTEGQFAVQHARYIYLTYIDSCAPLQVNLSDETRTEIPWPILDDDHYQHLFDPEAQSASGGSTPGSPAPSSTMAAAMTPITKKKSRSGSSRRGAGRSSSTTSRFSRQRKRQQEEDDTLLGWPFDRHMFDGAQEHTYQLMKGHTLVRFEESDLWKAVLRIIQERPEDYAKATIKGPLSLHYKPDTAVILKTVTRSRSRHPATNLQNLYNWNNSTSDLDRSRDKEEVLARTMNQYFGPIPPSIRHPGRITIVGLGREGMDDELEEDGYFDSYDLVGPLECGHLRASPSGSVEDGPSPSKTATTVDASKRSSSGSSVGGPRRSSRFVKRLSNGIAGRSSAYASQRHSVSSDNPPSYYSLDQDPAHPGYHADSEVDDMTLDSIENGKRTTRWMVSGYFNDQVRLTAAQRKRLLRRNNKLTKFFGSRVDGTLRPVEERIEDQTTGLSSSQSSILRAPGTGSTTLAYALSSSTIQDMPLNGRRKQTKQQLQQQRRLKKSNSKAKHLPQSKVIRASESGSGERASEEPLFIPDAAGRGLTSPTRSSGLLNKFKKYASVDDYGPSAHQNDAGTTTRSGRSSNVSGHARSFTASDAPLNSLASPGQQQQRRRFTAHPHPLWSGSLSDQEGMAPTIFERRRGLSILSVIDSSLAAESGISPTTPTSIALGVQASSQRTDPEVLVKSPTAINTGGHQLFTLSSITAHNSGSTLDRQAMLSRRKKADKLSTFFGAQLTAVELSSQLKMNCGDDELLMSSSSATNSTANGFSSLANRGLARSSTEDYHKNKAFPEATSVVTSSSSLNSKRPASAPAAPKTRTTSTTSPLAVVGPTFSSVNQLSTKERSILWRRNKKLRELLGESLPESAVALALTGPILFGGPSSSSSIGPRHTIRTSVSSRRTSVASSRHLPRIPTASGGRRISHPRVIYSQQARRGSRSSRSSLGGLSRQYSTNSLDSILAMENSMAAMVYRTRVAKEQDGYENEGAEDDDEDDDDDDNDNDDRHVSLKSPSTLARRRSSLRPIHRSTPSISSSLLSRPTISTSSIHPFGQLDGNDRTFSPAIPITPITPITPATPSPTETMSRFRQKKRMDKIQQFLGDKVPEQDLWIGAVGRERTMAMLELDPLTFQSPTSMPSQPLSISTAPLSSGSKKIKILGKNRLGGLGEMGSKTSPLSSPVFSRSGSSKFFERKTVTSPVMVSISPPASGSVSAPASASTPLPSFPSVLGSPTSLDSPSLPTGKAALLERSSEDTIESLGISAADL